MSVSGESLVAVSLLRDSASASASASAVPAFFPPCASFERPDDLAIVRLVVEREGCLEALQQLVGKPRDAHQPRSKPAALAAPVVLQSIVDQLRSVSVQIVEAVEQWQREQQLTSQAQARDACFRWRGVNYLLKMTADLDFLAAARGVALLEALQVLRLTQNPFLASLHLEHPALRDREPDMAIQLLGEWVGDVPMRRVFTASKALLREREADSRRRQLRHRLKQETAERLSGKSDHCEPQDAEESSLGVVSPLEPDRVACSEEKSVVSTRPAVVPVGASRGQRVLESMPSTHVGPREAAMWEDIVLSRELVHQAEHELGALRDELSTLQRRLADASMPDKRRELQRRVGGLLNTLKFRSGDLYQRKNELKRKEAVFRTTKDRASASSSSSSNVVDKPPQAQGQNQVQVPTTSSSASLTSTTSPLLEAELREDELVRGDLVSRVTAALARSRASKKPSGRAALKRQQGSSSRRPQQSSRTDKRGVQQWSVLEVQRFLDALALDAGGYGVSFRAQGIDGALLAQATEQDLEELGVAIRLHRQRILEAVAVGS